MPLGLNMDFLMMVNLAYEMLEAAQLFDVDTTSVSSLSVSSC